MATAIHVAGILASELAPSVQRRMGFGFHAAVNAHTAPAPGSSHAQNGKLGLATSGGSCSQKKNRIQFRTLWSGDPLHGAGSLGNRRRRRSAGTPKTPVPKVSCVELALLVHSGNRAALVPGLQRLHSSSRAAARSLFILPGVLRDHARAHRRFPSSLRRPFLPQAAGHRAEGRHTLAVERATALAPDRGVQIRSTLFGRGH